MRTSGPSISNRRKSLPAEERKRKKKATRTAKSSKRRRHDSPSPSSRSDSSSPSTFSSDLERVSGRASRDRKAKKEAIARQHHSPSREEGSSRRHKKIIKKKKRRGYQGRRDSKKHDSRSKLSKGDHQKKGHDCHRRRRSSSISSSGRSTSVGSLDRYSSRSCSTCRSHSSSPERAKSDRSLRSKDKVLKVGSSAHGKSSPRREKQRSGRRLFRREYRSRSPSCSPCSRCSHEHRSRSRVRGSSSERHHDEDRLTEKSRSEHPLSISTLAKHSNEMQGRYHRGKDGNRAEIIQDFDDFHTSRSNDSYDGERKSDSGLAPLPPLQHAPERRRYDDSSGLMGRNEHVDKGEAHLKREISSSKVATGPSNGAEWGNGNDSPTPTETQPRLKSQVSACGFGSEAEKLELLLRQKALENFKKFRARISTNANAIGENEFASIPGKAYELPNGKSEAPQFCENARPITIPAKQKSYASLEHRTPANNGCKLQELKFISDAHMPDLACGLVEKTERNNRKLVQRQLGVTVNSKGVPDSLFPDSGSCFKAESSGKIFSMDLSSKNTLDKKDYAEDGNADMHKNEAIAVDASASTDTSCNKSASEFEEKTMAVMHGGEVVQVSYKVYIPKKTPALARRRLER